MRFGGFQRRQFDTAHEELFHFGRVVLMHFLGYQRAYSLAYLFVVYLQVVFG